jgi:quinol monooxygenase YgiN
MPVAARDRHFSFSVAIAVMSNKPRQFILVTKKNLPSEDLARGVAWDLVRFDINWKKDTISTAKQSQGDHHMTTKALFVRLEAKPGKENEVAKFLRDGQGLVQQEPATTAWFGIKLGPTTFAIFDAFPDDAGRDAHLSGKVAKALMEKAPELLAEPPKIEKADVLADRLPG